MAVQNKPIPIGGMDDRDAFLIDPQYAANVRNVRSLRERITRSPGGTEMAPTPLPGMGAAGFGTANGSFQVPATTGNQQIPHSLGLTPQAMMLFITGPTSSGSDGGNIHMGYGMTDGTTSRACSLTSLATNPSQTGRRYSNAVVVLCNAAGAVIDSATWVSWNSTSFTINWGTVDGTRYKVMYVLFGNASLSAKVVEWTTNTSTGNQAVTGVGFQPQILVHLYADEGTINTGGVNGKIGITYGTATDRRCNLAITQNGIAGGNSQKCPSAQGLNAVTMLSDDTKTVTYTASAVSMDADGFTVDWLIAPATGKLIATLALGGFLNVKLQSFTMDTRTVPDRQEVTGVGFQPTGMFYFEIGNAPSLAGFNSFVGSYDGMNQTNANAEDPQPGPNSTFFKDGQYQSAPDRQFAIVNFTSDGWIIKVYQANFPATTFTSIAFSLPGTPGQVGIPRNYQEVYVGANPAVQNYVLLTNKSAFYYAPNDATTGLFLPTSETYTGTVTQRFSIANTQGIAAWSQGTDNIRQWDGTTFSNLVTAGTPFPTKYLIAFDDRIVAGYPTISGIAEPTQIKWSVNGNVNNWTGVGSGALELIETNQEPITGMFVLGDRAYVGKRHQLIEIIATGTLSPVFGTAPRVSGMGILAPFSIGLAEQVAFWLGPDDVYMWDGSTLTAVGERMYNTITQLIDYDNLDTVQGWVYTPDSQYWLAVPPYIFVYDYRRDIWDWDDSQNFQAGNVLNVSTPPSTLFTGDINKSQFIVVGDPTCITTRVDFQATSWLGNPIDSYFETKDYTAEELARQTLGSGWRVTLWDLNSLREVRFQSAPGNIVECAVSLDRGQTWVDVQSVVVNQNGVGVAWFQRPFSQIRFRFRDFGTDSYEIRGQWGHDVENSGYQYP